MKRKYIKVELEDMKAAPKNWKSVYAAIKDFRKTAVAPVDTEGCHMLAAKDVDAKTRRYQILCALQLSSQTKDQAMRNLRDHFGDSGFTCESIINIDPKVLDSLICKVGFHNKKVVYMQKTAAILQKEYDGDIPDTIHGMLELPGIGPKMGYLALQIAYSKTLGIGVDIHVHRISNRLGWVKSKNPEQTRAQLEEWMPRELWAEVNHLLVGFGQVQCTPLRPKCSDCRVRDLCPFS